MSLDSGNHATHVHAEQQYILSCVTPVLGDNDLCMLGVHQLKQPHGLVVGTVSEALPQYNIEVLDKVIMPIAIGCKYSPHTKSNLSHNRTSRLRLLSFEPAAKGVALRWHLCRLLCT